MDISFNSSSRNLNASSSLRNVGGKVSHPAAHRSVLGLSSTNRSTRGSVSGRSTTCHSAMVICRTPYHVVESYGSALPVMVTETIAYADRPSLVSVQLSNCGWAWLVCGRRLLIWQYKQNGPTKWQSVSQCRELTLPPSDLAHRAELVIVYTSKKAPTPSCIAVSPEGAVRYWPSISHEGSWIEESADLQGQECESLSVMTGLGCILATTTSTLCLVSPVVVNCRQSIQCKTLRSYQGWLGGFSRRVSSIIWGSMPQAQTQETRLVKVLACGNSDGADMLVLAGLTLQKWALSSKEAEKLVFEFDMSRLLGDSFLSGFWGQNTNAQDLRIWLLDMQQLETGVMILAAAANLHDSPQIRYAAVIVASDNSKAPDTFQMFCPIFKIIGMHHGEDSECEDLSFRFVAFGGTALIYNKHVVIAVPVTMNDSSADVDRLEFANSSGDAILGGSIYRTTPVFFSKINGVISITDVDESTLDMTNMSVNSEASSDMRFFTSQAMSQNQLSMDSFGATSFPVTPRDFTNKMPHEIDCVSKMKKAFVLFNRRELAGCKEILDSIFPPQTERKVEVDSPLDLVVIQVSKDIIDDIPASDPRWSESQRTGQSLGASSSLQVQQQLQGKQETLELFVNFLKAVNLWNSLSAVTARGIVIATSLALQEHAEKVAAALTLRFLHCSYSQLLDKAIKATLMVRKTESRSPALTDVDLFFQEVSKVQEILITLVHWSKEVVNSNRSPGDVVTALQEINHVVLETLQEVADFRKHHKNMFSCESMFASDLIEYLPWTASSHSEGLRVALSDLLVRNFQYAVHQCSSDQLAYSNLCVELLNMADLLLEGYSSHLESLKGSEKFDMHIHQYSLLRRKIIQPFIDEAMNAQGIKLAEKYHDFNTLIHICEVTNNQERLEGYITKFFEAGFLEYLLVWYMKENKQDRLMCLFSNNMRPLQQQQTLVSFLAQHPHLAWLHALKTSNYSSASNTLLQSAKMQSKRLARKKTMLSISKLAAIAADETDYREQKDIEDHLNLCDYQETLPESLVNYMGLDMSTMGVLSQTQLIQLYISDDNKNAGPFDFKKALDLLENVENPEEKSELRRSIWCQAVLRNDWENLNLDYPMESCKTMIFCQLFELLGLAGELDQALPEEELLSCVSLESLLRSTSFKFIIHYFYDHVSNTLEG